MVQIFEFPEYKSFLREWIKSQPSQGRGELRRMAQHLRVHPTLMSHITKGPKDLSAEQAFEMSGYLSLSETEREYFLCLVQHAKAGTKNLQRHLESKLEDMRRKSQDLSSKFENKIEMTNAEKGEFYSNWQYAAIHLAIDLPKGATVEGIADALALPQQLVAEKIKFLARCGLCEIHSGKIRFGTPWTHVDAKSPFVGNHHRNWRLKAMERHPNLSDSELAVSAPVVLSKKDAQVFRKKLITLIEDLKEIVTESKSEVIMNFNLDWIKISE